MLLTYFTYSLFETRRSSESEANKSVNSPFGQNYVGEPVDVIMQNIQAPILQHQPQQHQHAPAHSAPHTHTAHTEAAEHLPPQHVGSLMDEHPAGPSKASFIAVQPANG